MTHLLALGSDPELGVTLFFLFADDFGGMVNETKITRSLSWYSVPVDFNVSSKVGGRKANGCAVANSVGWAEPAGCCNSVGRVVT